ncbi:MAG: hypothetical protein FJ267_19890, partial [Planctomycetes bacterium]|nr:hypothetical protein [Planctomycetota bacterium]
MSDPLSSAEFAIVDTERLDEITTRHRQIADFLRQEKFAAMLIQQPSNFAWLTAGASNERGGSTGLSGSLFVTPEARVIICTNADTAQFFETEVNNMGFQLKERPWFEPRSQMLADLCRGRKVASDSGFPGTSDVHSALFGLRSPLSEYDRGRLRTGGQLLTHAIEATARGIVKGRSEAEIAGELSHRLLKHQLVPERLQILADGRGRRFRCWTYDDSPVRRYCSISAVARYQGLYIGAARTICLGDAPAELLKAFEPAALVHSTGIFFTQSNWSLNDVWSRVHRLYEKTGSAAEWRQSDQADVVEFEFGAVPLRPNSEFPLTEGTAVYWHPSVGPVLMGDTV